MSSEVSLWDNMQQTHIHYAVVDSSEHSGSYAAEHIRFDRPIDVQSRWSSSETIGSGDQYILLEMATVGVLAKVTFGKFHKPHPCNMKEFKIFVGMTPENMTEILSGALANDPNLESFSLPKTTTDGIPFPSRFVKIMPLSAHGKGFNTSIWFISLAGFVEENLVQTVIRNYEQSRETITMRHILKHLRQRRHISTYNQIVSRTGIQLEHPLVTELYETLVIRGDWTRAEQALISLASGGLFSSYINACQPYARWQRLRGVDKNGDAPSRRGGHAMCMDIQNQWIYLFGGFDGEKSLDDFWRYDVRSDSWEVISHHVVQQHGPGPRACHKMVFDHKTGYIYLLGRIADGDMPTGAIPIPESTSHGVYEEIIPVPPDEQAGRRPLDDVSETNQDSALPPLKDYSSEFYRYRTRGIDKGEWKLLNIDSAMNGGPRLVNDHQLVLDSDAQIIYVHGGRVVDGDWTINKYSGLYSYDIRTGKWTMIPPTRHQSNDSVVPPRFGHSMVHDPRRRKLFIFAGKQDSRYLNDMWEYDLRNGAMTELTSNFTASGGPDPCFAQRAVIDTNLGEIYVFDGLKRRRNGGTAAESAVWLYRYGARPETWLRVLAHSQTTDRSPPHSADMDTTSAPSPTKRSRNDARVQGNDDFYPDRPMARWAHQVVYDPTSQTFYMHGGNAGCSATSLRTKSEDGTSKMATEERLDDFWSMKLERPSGEVIRRATFAIRRQQFREMCNEVVPVKALTFLQTEVSAVVDHSNHEEAEAFRSLLSHLLAPPLPFVDSAQPTGLVSAASRNSVESESSTPSDSSSKWTSELPGDEDTVMTDATMGAGLYNGEGEPVDDPFELRLRAGKRLSNARFKQRTDVFESLLCFISAESKQPEGNMLDMVHKIEV